MILQELKQQIGTHVANARLEQALNLLSKYNDLFEFSISDQTLQLKSRLTKLNKDSRIGVLDKREENKIRNQITNAILSIGEVDNSDAIIESSVISKNVQLEIIELLENLMDEEDMININGYKLITRISKLF